VKEEPRKLLATVSGLTLVEMAECETCCGFGGTFAVKYAQISDEIVAKKVANIEQSGADFLIAGDLGCLMNMAGKMRRLGKSVKALHVAEVLAGMGDEPAIGEPRRGRAP
jgi:L-lactate dehydrogenase complex protein LldE